MGVIINMLKRGLQIKIIALMLIMSGSLKLRAQQKIFLSGKVFNSVTAKTVDFGTVLIMETKSKTYINSDGSFSIGVMQGGTYTLVIRVNGLKKFETKINITKDVKRDFNLQPITIRSQVIRVTGDKFLQKVSRRNMSRDDLKSTPASFGDAINALTSLPGIDRTQGFFGPLVIRGMFPENNRYFVDGMPINNPMHFGGVHSVINTNLMDEVNLYSSSFPARFGGAMGAVIDISTIDEVKESGGYFDIGLISTNFLFKIPFKKSVLDDKGEMKNKNDGYLIASGRYGYLGFFIPFLYEQITGETPVFVPEYYDYQVKFRKDINDKESFSFLFLGSSDSFRFLSDEEQFDEEDDPLLNDLEVETDERFNNLGLYYTYKDGSMKNRVMLYGSLTESNNYVNSNQLPANIPDWLEDFEQSMRPYIFGVKNTFDLEWIKNHSDLKVEAEYTYYYFQASGDVLTNATGGVRGNDGFEDIIRIPLDINSINHAIGGFIENRFVYGGLTFVPGFRSDYLNKSGIATWDPRVMVSYEFETDTTISIASGKYSSFFQLNPFVFNYRPDFTTMDLDDVEKAYHNVIGIEQRVDLFTIGVEGYYNYFRDLAVEYPHYKNGEFLEGQMTGKAKVYGFELMVRKDKRKGRNGVFGWLSYTYSKSMYKSGVTSNSFDENGNDTGIAYDATGDKWISSDYDRRHSVKLVMGYTYGNITLSSKFQYFSSFPYTGIVGSEADPSYPGRYTPVYDIDNKNSERFPNYHSLDLRFSHKTTYEWGYVNWYIEVINVYMSKDTDVEWKYNQPYSASNPVIEPDDGLTIIPNFGVEVKF